MLEEKIAKCPVCGSQKSYKEGIRSTRSKEIQRYQCREYSENVNEIIWHNFPYDHK